MPHSDFTAGELAFMTQQGRANQKRELLVSLRKAQQALVDLNTDEPEALHMFRLIMDEVLRQLIRDLES